MLENAKIKWITDGDENICLFHGSLKHKNHKNKIHRLTISSEWKFDPAVIKKEVHNFFQLKFHESWPVRPNLISSSFIQFSQLQFDFLDSPFSFDEIKSTIWSYGGDKNLSADGLTFCLIKNKRDLIKADIFSFV